MGWNKVYFIHYKYSNSLFQTLIPDFGLQKKNLHYFGFDSLLSFEELKIIDGEQKIVPALEKIINYLFYFAELPDCTLLFKPNYLEENALFIDTLFDVKKKNISNSYFNSAIPGMNLQNLYIPLRSKNGCQGFLGNLTHNNKVNYIECDSCLDLELVQNYDKKQHNGIMCNFSRDFCTDNRFSWNKHLVNGKMEYFTFT